MHYEVLNSNINLHFEFSGSEAQERCTSLCLNPPRSLLVICTHILANQINTTELLMQVVSHWWRDVTN